MRLTWLRLFKHRVFVQREARPARFILAGHCGDGPSKGVVPVHWENFYQRLPEGLKPTSGVLGSTRWAINWGKCKVKREPRAVRPEIRIMDLRESAWLAFGDIYIPK